jgi:hypothetical protein
MLPFSLHLTLPLFSNSMDDTARQREAKRISDDIDAEIEATRRKLKNDTSVKVLLLGMMSSNGNLASSY